MGMYDQVLFESWCPRCGHREENQNWQSKNGHCQLDVFTLEEFERHLIDYWVGENSSTEDYQKKVQQHHNACGTFSLIARCDSCYRWITLELINEIYMDIAYPGWGPCRGCGGNVVFDEYLHEEDCQLKGVSAK